MSNLRKLSRSIKRYNGKLPPRRVLEQRISNLDMQCKLLKMAVETVSDYHWVEEARDSIRYDAKLVLNRHAVKIKFDKDNTLRIEKGEQYVKDVAPGEPVSETPVNEVPNVA